MEQTVYVVGEDNETMQVTVSTNKEHLFPVIFEVIFTNNSAICKSSTNAVYVFPAFPHLCNSKPLMHATCGQFVQ